MSGVVAPAVLVLPAPPPLVLKVDEAVGDEEEYEAGRLPPPPPLRRMGLRRTGLLRVDGVSGRDEIFADAARASVGELFGRGTSCGFRSKANVEKEPWTCKWRSDDAFTAAVGSVSLGNSTGLFGLLLRCCCC